MASPILPPPIQANNSRSAIIGEWIARVQATEASLAAMRTFLQEALGQATEAVDGHLFLDLEEAAIQAMGEMYDATQRLEHEEFYQILTGWRSYILVLRKEIVEGKMDAAQLQVKISAIMLEDQPGGALLQSLLAARMQLGGAR